MKLAYALMLASTLAAPAALVHAGDKDGHKDMKMHHLICDETDEGCLTKGLNLTNDQQQKLRAIHQDARQKREALRNETHQRIKQVLTPEQQQKLDARRDEIMKARAEHMRNKADRMEKKAEDKRQ